MNKLEQIVTNLVNTSSDINEHLVTLIKYGSECEHITEMGVRWIISTWAFLGCAPKKLISYDKQNPSNWGANIQDVYDIASEFGLDFTFIEKSVLEVEIEETDLLFLDTLHTYGQLKAELSLHPSKVRKYMIFHDTSNYEFRDEIETDTEKKGLWPAIEEFLEEHKEWCILERYTNNNGLLILKRI